MKKSKRECDEKSCFMCRVCLKQWTPAIAANKVNFKVKRGEVIFNEGDEVTGVYFVYEGIVKVHKRWGNDKELIVRFACQGAMLGHRGLGPDKVYPISATALTDCMICYLDMDFFESTLKVNTEFTYSLMMFLASELQASEQKMRNLAHMPVKGRVAQALILLHDQFGAADDLSINIELSRQDLASFAGTTYETVFRVLNELLKENLVIISGKKITLINRENLAMLVAEEL